MVKAMIRDAVLYVNPLMSLYIFVTWMHCVWCSSLRLAPVYFIGFLILILLDGYLRYGPSSIRNLGYSPVSIQEIILSLLNTTSSSQIQPILAEKKVKTSSGCQDFDTERLDHMEFPFSDGSEYKKRTIGEVLVKRSTSGRREQREGNLHYDSLLQQKKIFSRMAHFFPLHFQKWNFKGAFQFTSNAKVSHKGYLGRVVG
jgi:hypothetical protein